MINRFFLAASHQPILRNACFAVLLALFAFSQISHADDLSASVDRDTIGLQETLTLTLRFSGQTSDSPDFSLLQEDFDILNTQQSNQMRVINGNMESYTDWRIAIAPKRIGNLVIPAFAVKGASSDPIAITVESQNRAPKNADSNVFVEVTTDTNSVYVQQQILVTIRLYTSVNLNGAELQAFELPDTLVVDLGETQYQTAINGRQHIVVERTYSLFPQHSGELVIPSLTYQVSVRGEQRDPWGSFGGNRNNNLLRLRTEEQKITVNSIPPQFSGEAWLPAKKLDLTEHWSSGTDQLKVGEPITRTITIAAEGLTAGQISPLVNNTVDGLTFYPDQAQTDDQNTPKGVKGSRIETTAIIPTRSGNFTLPAISVNWWDTVNQKMQTAVLPAKSIYVADTPASLAKSSEPEPAQPTPIAPVAINTDLNRLSTAQPHTQSLLWLTISTAIASLLALLFAYLYWRARQELAAIHSLYTEDKNKVSLAEKAAWTELKRACINKDYPAIRNACLGWAQAYWQDPSIHSLKEIADRVKNEKLHEQLEQLNAALYRNGADKWDTEELLQQLQVIRRKKDNGKATRIGLAPLYKS